MVLRSFHLLFFLLLALACQPLNAEDLERFPSLHFSPLFAVQDASNDSARAEKQPDDKKDSAKEDKEEGEEEKPYQSEDPLLGLDLGPFSLYWPAIDLFKPIQRDSYWPLFDANITQHIEFRSKNDSLTRFELAATVPAPIWSFFQVGVEAEYSFGTVNRQNAHRAKLVATGGFFWESGPKDQEFSDWPFIRRNNVHELRIFGEWGLVEMQAFQANDNQTLGAIRFGIGADAGLNAYRARVRFAFEVYVEDTLQDAELAVGLGRPIFPVGILIGIRYMRMEGFSGSFVTIGIEFGF